MKSPDELARSLKYSKSEADTEKGGSLATAAGKLGEAGGPARAKALSPSRRAAIARLGALAMHRRRG
jgi:hypothetical protein